MTAISLMTPILKGGIQNVNFVNGRILTAADMTAERTANLQRQRLLGTCLGDGVASGLEVTLSAGSVAFGQQVVHVTAGVAVNRNGDVLQLASDIDLGLSAPPQPAAANPGLFAPCLPPQTQLTNPGIYVLTVMSASGYRGHAPVTQLNSGGVGVSCASQYATAGVQFRLAPITLASTGTGLQPTLYALANQIQASLNSGATAASLAPSLSQFRNGLAHVCFGTEALAAYAANPFPPLSQTSSFDSYGLIDSLRTSGLTTDCEVPLAIMYWTPGGIQFIDLWSVRRPVLPQAVSEEWPLFGNRRGPAEGLAMFLQFQDQLTGLASALSSSALISANVSAYFLYLPAAGLVPIANSHGSAGFDSSQFFSGPTHRRPVFIEGATLVSILRRAMEFPPINLNSQELLWIYEVRENQQTIDNSSANSPQFYYLFTNGHLPFQGDAKYDLNYWDYANFV